MEEKKESSITTIYEHVVTKNPMFYLQEGLRVILKCLGFESSKPDQHESSSSSSSSSSMSDDTKKKEEEKNIKEDQSDEQQKCCVFQEDDPQRKQQSVAEAEDPPPSQTLNIEAATGRRGRTPPKPIVGRGSPPQNN